MIGKAVGGYVVLDRIGAGGMGEVYLGQHRRLERRAAIKFLLPGLSRDEGLVSRFFNEARVLSRIEHPGIVEVFDCDVLEDRAFIVMEYLDGESMAAVLSRSTGFGDEANAVAAVVGQIASALEAAHGKGIIHRDLKPENLFLCLGREVPFGVRVLDFGIAKLVADNLGETAHTRPGSLLGTPSYMAPEQCRGLSGIDHRVDIYSLGCIMFELLAGRKVFEMEAPGDLIVAHIQSPPPRLAACVPRVPKQLDALVGRMLSKDPDDRPQSMLEVIAALEDLLGIPAASFAQAIPVTSRLLPLSRFGSVGAATASPVVRDDKPSVSTGDPPVQATPMLRSGAVAGSTQLLPGGLDPPTVHPAPTAPNDSTFRRTAGEILPAPKRRAGPIAIVAGLGAAALAATLAVAFRSNQRVATPAELPHPVATSPSTRPASPPGRPATPIDRARNERVPKPLPVEETPPVETPPVEIPPDPRSQLTQNGGNGARTRPSSFTGTGQKLRRKDAHKNRHESNEGQTPQPLQKPRFFPLPD